MLTDRNWPLVSRLVFTCAAAEQPNSFTAQTVGKQRRGSKAEIHYIPCCILYTILMKLQVNRKEKLTTPNGYCKLKCDYVIFMAWWIALEKKIGLRWFISFLWTLTYYLNGWNANFWQNLINKKTAVCQKAFPSKCPAMNWHRRIMYSNKDDSFIIRIYAVKRSWKDCYYQFLQRSMLNQRRAIYTVFTITELDEIQLLFFLKTSPFMLMWKTSILVYSFIRIIHQFEIISKKL